MNNEKKLKTVILLTGNLGAGMPQVKNLISENSHEIKLSTGERMLVDINQAFDSGAGCVHFEVMECIDSPDGLVENLKTDKSIVIKHVCVSRL